MADEFSFSEETEGDILSFENSHRYKNWIWNVNDRIVYDLKLTKFWINFVIIVFLISVPFSVIGILFDYLYIKEQPLIISHELRKVSAIINYMFLVAYFYLFYKLIRYNGSVSKIINGGGISALEISTLRQKEFWRSVGIFTLILMIIGFSFIFLVFYFAYQEVNVAVG